MNQPKLNTSMDKPLAHLPPAMQEEIAEIEKRVRKQCRERMLYSYGEVRSWLIFGNAPTGQLAMALGGADEAEWKAYLLERQEAGAPIPESTGRVDLAAYEMPRRWSGLLTFIERSVLPPGGELKTWPGFVPLALKLQESAE